MIWKWIFNEGVRKGKGKIFPSTAQIEICQKKASFAIFLAEIATLGFTY